MTVSRIISAVMIVLLVMLLVFVRLFEVELFNDPLNDYYRSNFQFNDMPNISVWKVIAGTSLRFFFNMVISLWIIWFLYKKVSYINAALWVYLFAYGILILLFTLLLDADSDFMKMALFYIRRFLIHPILLFVLVAGFYFLKTKGNKLT
ncbi:MAG: exosortase F system-associated membrane protein [Nonlabens sp.]|uniref:exosortase F system-associated membrane protein n=1 Tax=Nonlabens sp. TaxID=1888209 RepID=UPI003EF9D1D7